MKKLLALVFVLCLLCVSAASADVLTSTGEPFVADEFTLALDAGVYYEVSEKTAGELYLAVVPYYYETGSTANFTFRFDGGPYTLTAAELDARREEDIQQVYDMLAGSSVNIDSLEMTYAVETTFCGAPCISRETNMILSAGDTLIPTLSREYCIYSKGYTVTLTADDTESLDQMEDLLAAILIWN